MQVFEQLNLDMGYFLLGVTGGMCLLLILILVLFLKNRKLNKKYKAFMQGLDGKSLEDVFQSRFKEIDCIKDTLQENKSHLDKIDATLVKTYQKLGIVKYDAFREMGGNLSFALALLNEDNSGYIINSVHSTRAGNYTYVKEIYQGQSKVLLAEEEQEALQKAINESIINN